MDFLKFFGLKEDPFKLTPDPAYFYPSSSHNEGLLLMDYSIDQKEGFVLVIGDPGTGKTTMLKVFLEKWKSRAETAIIFTPRLSPEEFLTAVAEDLKINLRNKNKNELIRAIRDFMTKKSSEGKRVIIIVDEAQNVPDDTLEELRLLSNLETDKDKLIQIILLGQPELESKLISDKLRQLNQRITTRVHLQHFNLDETQDYINYRVIKAGKENLQINRKASRLAYKLSNGIPRLINMLISRALMAAYLEESNMIDSRHIRHAVKSLNHSEMKLRTGYGLIPVSAGLLAIVLIVFSVYFYQQKSDMKHPATAESPFMTGESMQKQSGTDPTANEGVNVPEQGQAPDFKLVFVNVDVAIVRDKPTIDSRKVGWSLKGNQLVVLQEYLDNNSMKWYQIALGGERRWISGEVVEVIDLNTPEVSNSFSTPSDSTERGEDISVIPVSSEILPEEG